MFRMLSSLALLSLGVAGCQTPDHCADKNTMASFEACDGEQEVGNFCIVALEANGTTGYDWELQMGHDDDVLALVSQDYMPECGGLNREGGGGLQTFEFEVIGTGSTTIEFWYMDYSDNPPEEIWTETVTVTE